MFSIKYHLYTFKKILFLFGRKFVFIISETFCKCQLFWSIYSAIYRIRVYNIYLFFFLNRWCSTILTLIYRTYLLYILRYDLLLVRTVLLYLITTFMAVANSISDCDEMDFSCIMLKNSSLHNVILQLI